MISRGPLAGLALLALLASTAAVGLGAEDAGTSPDVAGTSSQKPDDKVHITLQTVPPRKAVVKWGRKTLGVIPVPRPLVVVRPRDSGPMDLVVRVTGFLPVHTRAYTFSDSRVAIKLTPVEEKNTLFGFRAEVSPDAGANPDAGAPPPAPMPPPAPAPAPQR
ncbi:MAG TPA: hypothetical protein VJ860_03400 [Polyangia bacterium]|jgi:hypothetical protein|nr:hypothetical protein [Polyangia bacterium]